MAAPAFLGDEVSAAGYRLAGALVRTPRPGEEAEALAWACRRAPLVLVTSSVAAAIAEPVWRAAVSSLSPLVLAVPDLRGEVPLPDLAARLRAQLGLDA